MIGRALAALPLIALVACGEPSPREGQTRLHRESYAGSDALRAELHQVWSAGAWRNDGAARFFDPEGRLTHAGTYLDGLETGVWQEFAPDGSLGEGPYVDGQRHGEWTYSAKARDGKRPVVERGRYTAGQRTGVWKRWDTAGTPLPDRSY